jgi:hypothetical protein
MYDNGFQFLINSELDYFEDLFEDRKIEKANQITFNEFKDIVMNFKKFNRMVSSEILDKIKRKLKERQSALSIETEIAISKGDYFEYLDSIYLEHNRLTNERDPEFSKY